MGGAKLVARSVVVHSETERRTGNGTDRDLGLRSEPKISETRLRRDFTPVFRAASALTSERSGSYKAMSRDLSIDRVFVACSVPDLELVATKIFFENRYAS